MLTPIMQPILQPVLANLDYDYGDNFSPAALFTSGKKGFWYKPNDVSTIYQDSSGSTAGAVNSPVGKVLDLSGNGNHATQSTSTARPTLKTVNGKNVLVSDFVDDYMNVPAMGEDVDVYINTPYGNYVSQLDGAASRIPLNYPCEIVAVSGLTTQQKAALKNYFKTEEKYLILVNGSTTASNFRCYTGGGNTDIVFTGANGISVTKTLNTNTSTSFDLATDGLTAPVVVAWSSSLIGNTALTYFHYFNNSLTGSLRSFSDNTALEYSYGHSNALTGIIPSFGGNNALTLYYRSVNQLTGVQSGFSVPASLGDFRVQDNLLPRSAIDTILAAFVAAGRSSGTRILYLHGTGNAAPSLAGAADKTTLISRGWTVITN